MARTAPVSAWAPLSDRRFRITWFAFLAAMIVIWAQTVGAVKVITSQSDSPTLVALIQTAISLPGVALALFAGAVADIVDRRRMLVGAGLAMVAAMATLAALTATGVATPAAVLALTAALGAGLAMFLPAFSAMVPDLVPRPMLLPAIAITGVTVNIARAAGPALAGVAIAVAGAGVLFWMLAAVLVAVVVTLALVGPPSTMPERSERLGAAVRAGARYARFAGPLRRVITRTALFVLFGSALWAMLPVVAERRLGFGASGFGLLLGCVGSGAVAGALVLPHVRARFGLDQIVAAASALLAAVLILLVVVRAPVLGAAVLVLAGVAWISVLTVVLGAAQSAAPDWVRGRALSAWLVAYQGGLAAGSVVWGAVAEASLRGALLIPAGGLLLLGVAGRWFALDVDEDAELGPSGSWGEPVVVMEVGDDEGPVLVTVEYEVAAGNAEAFIAAMEDLAAIRQRDGARRWQLYRDIAAPGCFVETFMVPTWGEHLLQHDRSTLADTVLEARTAELAEALVVRHLVAVRDGRPSQLVSSPPSTTSTEPEM